MSVVRSPGLSEGHHEVGPTELMLAMRQETWGRGCGEENIGSNLLTLMWARRSGMWSCLLLLMEGRRPAKVAS